MSKNKAIIHHKYYELRTGNSNELHCITDSLYFTVMELLSNYKNIEIYEGDQFNRVHIADIRKAKRDFYAGVHL